MCVCVYVRYSTAGIGERMVRVFSDADAVHCRPELTDRCRQCNTHTSIVGCSLGSNSGALAMTTTTVANGNRTVAPNLLHFLQRIPTPKPASRHIPATVPSSSINSRLSFCLILLQTTTLHHHIPSIAHRSHINIFGSLYLSQRLHGIRGRRTYILYMCNKWDPPPPFICATVIVHRPFHKCSMQRRNVHNCYFIQFCLENIQRYTI